MKKVGKVVKDNATICGEILRRHIPSERSGEKIDTVVPEIKKALQKTFGISEGGNVAGLITSFLLKEMYMGKDVEYARYIFEEVFFKEFQGSKHFKRYIPSIMFQLEGIDDLVELEEREIDPEYIDSIPPIKERLRYIHSHAETDTPLLIIGETGTSKGLVAKAIHKMSKRRRDKFLNLNCAGIQENLIESELFGHVEGAFTGANKEKEGLLKSADKGTVFLDEIGKMPKPLQVRLLKVIEEKPHDIEEEHIHPDLLYRLGYSDHISLPNLSERLHEGGSSLIYFCLYNVKDRMGIKESLNLSGEVREYLTGYQYKGNYRELENILRSAVRSALFMNNRTEILMEDLKKFKENIVKTPEVKLSDIKLIDIIDHAEKIKASTVEKKIKEVIDSKRDIKTVLVKEGMNPKQYVAYLNKLKRVTGKKLSELKSNAG
jgi:transcriptional regulator with PAS, ATPase and Fis domain